MGKAGRHDVAVALGHQLLQQAKRALRMLRCGGGAQLWPALRRALTTTDTDTAAAAPRCVAPPPCKHICMLLELSHQLLQRAQQLLLLESLRQGFYELALHAGQQEGGALFYATDPAQHHLLEKGDAVLVALRQGRNWGRR